MTGDILYSIRMRASLGRKHLSGAERIASAGRVDGIVSELLARARSKSSFPDHVSITVESLQNTALHCLTALDVQTISVPDMQAGRDAVGRLLEQLGVSAQAATLAINYLSSGAAPEGNTMRGAMIMDAQSGERLEPDRERGVRASRFDWTGEASAEITALLADAGLTHHRIREALALASKITHAAGVVAELCWSDDPDYTAGYVASLKTGYIRIPLLKQIGDQKGGRAIFVDSASIDLDSFIKYLQVDPVLIHDVGTISKETGWEQALALLQDVS